MRIEDHYEIQGLLGEGAFGRTFAGRELGTGVAVVLKLMNVRGSPGWKPIEYFEREVAVLRALDHPGVPRFMAAFETHTEQGPTLVLAMARIEGETLLARIRRGHRWSEQQARALLESLLETLDYLHGLSPPVIHRDVKPGNIVLGNDGRPVLVDFGAVHDWRNRNGSLSMVGTVGYIAPEQAMGAPVAGSDLYALGATVVHALSHCHPADLPRRGLKMAFADRLGCSSALIAVLQRLVEPDVGKRYQRAFDVLADLRRPSAPAPAAPLVRAADQVTVRLDAPGLVRRLTPEAEVQLNARASNRVLRTLSVWGAMMVVSAVSLTVAGIPAASLVLVAALAIFGVAGTLAFVPSNRQHLDLQRNGVATEGRVWQVHPEASTHPARALVRYDFRVRDNRYRGEIEAWPRATRAPQVNDPILVVYDPANPAYHLATLVE